MNLESSQYVSPDDFYNREDFMYFQQKARGSAITRIEVANVLDLIPDRNHLRILDTPCGFGRHSIEFASRGHNVTGIDKSKAFIDEAIENSDRHKVTFLRDDLDAIVEVRAFDLIVNLFNSFGYFDHRRNLRFLSRCRDQLKDGGLLVIDTINGERLRESGFLEPVVLRREQDSLHITKQIRFDKCAGVNVEYTMASSLRGNRCHTRFSIRFYSPALLKTMLLESGFSAVQSYKALTEMIPLTADSKYMVIAAIK